MTTTDDLNALLTIHDGDVFRPDFGDGSGTGDGWSRPSRHYRVPEHLTEDALP